MDGAASKFASVTRHSEIKKEKTLVRGGTTTNSPQQFNPVRTTTLPTPLLVTFSCRTVTQMSKVSNFLPEHFPHQHLFVAWEKQGLHLDFLLVSSFTIGCSDIGDCSRQLFPHRCHLDGAVTSFQCDFFFLFYRYILFSLVLRFRLVAQQLLSLLVFKLRDQEISCLEFLQIFSTCTLSGNGQPHWSIEEILWHLQECVAVVVGPLWWPTWFGPMSAGASGKNCILSILLFYPEDVFGMVSGNLTLLF